MNTTYYDTRLLYEELDEARQKMLRLLYRFSNASINQMPENGGWTAAQVAAHMIRSNTSLVKALGAPGKITTREYDEKVPEIESIMLNLSIHMESPDFIRPARKDYDTKSLLADLEHAFDLVKAIGEKVNLKETMFFPGFGELSKLEVLHFILNHTRRHIYQLQKLHTTFYNL